MTPLSDAAKTVLESRYYLRDENGKLLEDWDGLCRRVAKHISSNDTKYEDKFYKMINERLFIPNSPTLFNAGTGKNMFSACVSGDTLVYTKDGLVEMANIQVGDMVLTHMGRFRKVQYKVFNGIKETIGVKSKYGDTRCTKYYNAFLTKDHKIYTKEKSWVDVESVDEAYVPFVNDDTEKFIEKINVKALYNKYNIGLHHLTKIVINDEYIDNDNDFALIFGMYLANGNIDKGVKVRFTINVADTDVIKFICSFFEKKFSYSPSVYYSNHGNWVTININSPIVSAIFTDLFGKGFKEKKIPRWVFNAPKEYIENLIRGLEEDGCIVASGSIKTVLNNPTLVYQMSLLYRKIGIDVNVSLNMWEPATKKNKTCGVFTSIDKRHVLDKSVITFLKPVYDIQVEEDNSFIAGDIICHNCFVVPIKDEMGSCDSKDAITDSWKTAALIGKMGGGVGFDFSELRHKEAKLSVRGSASGPISFMKVIDSVADAVKQGGCFIGDTLIATVTGPKKIKDIVDGDIVYCWDNGYKLNKAKTAIKTKSNTEVWKLTTDKGLVVYATPDHKFLLRSSNKKETKYIKLSELKIGTPIMPMSRYKHRGEMVISMHDGKDTRLPEHRFIANYFDITGEVIHHVDGNHFNNSSDNLLGCTHAEHSSIHMNALIQNGDHPFLRLTKEQREKGINGYKAWYKNTPETYKQQRRRDRRRTTTASNRKRIESGTHNFINNHPCKNGETLKKIKMSTIATYGYRLLEMGLPVTVDTWYESCKKAGFYNANRYKVSTIVKYFGSWDNFIKYLNENNHKVLSVEFSHCEDVYDIEVEGAHNFVVCSPDMRTGIVVHNSRRIALMGVLRVDHPDIMDFISCKQVEGQISNFNISIAITNDFIDALKNNLEYELIDPHTKSPVKKIKAQDVWDKICNSAWSNGEPGIIFIDRMNKYHNLKKLGEIKSTNPCVANGTLVNTPRGYVKVENLCVGDEISTIYGKEEIKSIEKNNDIAVFKITFSDGGEQIVTAAHRYYSIKNGSQSKNVVSRRVDELSVGDYVRVNKSSYSSKFGNYKHGLKIGILLGDGCYTYDYISKNMFKIATNKEDVEYNKNVVELFCDYKKNADYCDKDSKSMSICFGDGKKMIDDLSLVPNKSYDKNFDICDVNSEEYAMGILDGLLSTDGDILLKSNHPQIRFTTSSKELASNIRLLLISVGCHGRITSSFNDDGGVIGDRKIKRKHPKYSVCVSGSSVERYIDITRIGEIHPIKYKKLQELKKNWLSTGNTWKAKIVSIEPHGVSDVYDLYCDGSDTWITGGYVQQGCGEQPLLPWEACVLGSIDVAKFIKDKQFDFDVFKEVIYLSVRFLDNIITLQTTPFKEIDKTVQSNRKIGLGIMGFANALIKLGYSYGSDESFEFAEELAKFLKLNAHNASVELANERGAFPNHKYYHDVTPGLPELVGTPRNACQISEAPTGTISIIADTSSGIEPNYANAFIRNILNGKKILFVNPLAEQILTENGYDGAIEKLKNGSKLKDLKVKKEIKSLLITAEEISPEDHIKMQSIFQKYCDSSISKTINMPNESTVEDVSKAYMLAWDLGCKGVTIYRDGSRDAQVMETVNRKKKNIPCVRPSKVFGHTTKVATDLGKLYITINKHNNEPVEVLFNTKGPENDIGGITNDVIGTINALAIMISIALKFNTPVGDIVKALKKIKQGTPLIYDGKRYASIPIVLAHLLEEGNVQIETKESPCEKCGQPLVMQEGCMKCSNLECGYSKCG